MLFQDLKRLYLLGTTKSVEETAEEIAFKAIRKEEIRDTSTPYVDVASSGIKVVSQFYNDDVNLIESQFESTEIDRTTDSKFLKDFYNSCSDQDRDFIVSQFDITKIEDCENKESIIRFIKENSSLDYKETDSKEIFKDYRNIEGFQKFPFTDRRNIPLSGDN